MIGQVNCPKSGARNTDPVNTTPIAPNFDMVVFSFIFFLLCCNLLMKTNNLELQILEDHPEEENEQN